MSLRFPIRPCPRRHCVLADGHSSPCTGESLDGRQYVLGETCPLVDDDQARLSAAIRALRDMTPCMGCPHEHPATFTVTCEVDGVPCEWSEQSCDVCTSRYEPVNDSHVIVLTEWPNAVDIRTAMGWPAFELENSK